MKLLGLLNTDKQAQLDDDFNHQFLTELTWGLAAGGYVVSTNHHSKLGQVRLHRLVMNFPAEMIDHKDGNPLNCQKENLRLCNKSQNAVNTGRKTIHINSRAVRTSKYKGVYWSFRNERWLAQIRYNYKVVYGGYFDSELEAAKRANALYQKFHGEFAKLNELPI